MWVLDLLEMAGNSNILKMNNSYTLMGTLLAVKKSPLKKKVERIIGQMWVSPYQFILDIEQLRWGVTMHQWQLLMAFLSKEVGTRYALELLQ